MSERHPSQVTRRSLFPALALAVGALVVPIGATAQQAKARIESAITSDSRETMAEKEVFAPSTPKVYVIYMMADAPKGTRLKAIWYAEKAEGVEANSKMNESTGSSGSGTYWGAVSYSKPTAGWPIGTYKVELYLDDKLEKTVRFKVAK